jgi:hypothetical protein
MNIEYETRIVKVIVAPKGGPIFSEQATIIEIDDEAAGEFVKVSQEGGQTDLAKFICFNPDEWVAIRTAIDDMISRCRSSHLIYTESDGLDNPNSLKSKELARIEASADDLKCRDEIADFYEKLR